MISSVVVQTAAREPPAAVTNAPGCSDTECCNHFLVNIFENSGTLIVGDHTVVQVPEGIHEKKLKAGRHVKIKEHVNRLEASEHRRRKRSDRRRSKRLKRHDSRSTTPSTDEDVRDATLNEIALES